MSVSVEVVRCPEFHLLVSEGLDVDKVYSLDVQWCRFPSFCMVGHLAIFAC